MRPAYDQIIQGMSGIMDVTGSAEKRAVACRITQFVTRWRNYGGARHLLPLSDRSTPIRTRAHDRCVDARGHSFLYGWVVSNF